MKRILFYFFILVCLSVSCKKDDIVVVVEADLSVAGTANCYMVSTPGRYEFLAVKGNSNESQAQLQALRYLGRGCCWACNSVSYVFASIFSFSTDGYVYPDIEVDRAGGLAVRCLKEL